jgi:hypothetical protein
MGVTVKQMREVEDRLRAMPMDRFLDGVFGSGRWVYDQNTNLWIVADPRYRGPGFGYLAVRPDKSFFKGVVPAGVFQ